MEISKERKDLIWAICAFIFFTLIFTFSVLPFYYGIILGVFVGFFMLIKSDKPKTEKKNKIFSIILLIITPFVLFFLTELCNMFKFK